LLGTRVVLEMTLHSSTPRERLPRLRWVFAFLRKLGEGGSDRLRKRCVGWNRLQAREDGPGPSESMGRGESALSVARLGHPPLFEGIDKIGIERALPVREGRLFFGKAGFKLTHVLV
jgi:hypothetical protein